MLIMVIGASALVLLVLISGLIYRYCCGFYPSETPQQPDPQSQKATDATAVQLAEADVNDQESPDKREIPENTHESFDQISEESEYIRQKRKSMSNVNHTKVNKSIHDEHVTE